MALTGMLLSMLFRFLVYNTQFANKIERASAAVMQTQRVQERLESLLTSLEPSDSGAPSFYTTLFPEEKGSSLVIYFNAGIDPDPEYSNAVMGRFYTTEQGEFCFSYWPRAKEGFRTEVLLRDVRDFEWQFLGQKAEKSGKAVAIKENWAWLNEWPKKRGGTPQIVRLRLWCAIDKKKQREPNLQFAFILPAQEPIAIYK